MKRFLHFLIILFTFGCYFQAYGLGDSLKRELKNQTIDSVKVDILMSIARTYAINKPDSADIYINQLRDLSKSINQPEGLISAEMSSALKFAYTDNLSASNEKLFDAAKIAEKYKRIIRLNEIYLTLGINNLRMAKYDEAIEYLNKSLELAKKNNDLEKLGRTYVTLGIFYNKQGQYRKEQKYLFRALDVFKNGKSLSNLSSVYGNIG